VLVDEVLEAPKSALPRMASSAHSWNSDARRRGGRGKRWLEARCGTASASPRESTVAGRKLGLDRDSQRKMRSAHEKSIDMFA
jgi:hypothetical protein